MRSDDIRLLFDYNYWANERILSAAAKLSEEQLCAPAQLYHGSLRACLLHTLSAEWIWRCRCQEGTSPPAMLSEADFPTLDALRARWQAEEKAMRSFLASLRDEDLDRIVRGTTTWGKPIENVLWQLLVHVVNHGTQTRSEAAMLLSEYGQSPGDIDLFVFLRKRG